MEQRITSKRMGLVIKGVNWVEEYWIFREKKKAKQTNKKTQAKINSI